MKKLNKILENLSVETYVKVMLLLGIVLATFGGIIFIEFTFNYVNTLLWYIGLIIYIITLYILIDIIVDCTIKIYKMLTNENKTKEE